MAYVLDDKMVIGVSSRALFDLTAENEIFESRGLEAYQTYQLEHEKDVLKPGPGFELVKSLLHLNEVAGKTLVEVIIMSRNSTNTSLRVFNSIKHYGLDITRAVLASGASLSPYLKAFKIDLFLSAHEDDVQNAINAGIAAGIICTDHSYGLSESSEFISRAGQIRIAFDGDAVLFSDASEKVYKEQGLEAFAENEARNADIPLAEGPFAAFLKKLSALRGQIGEENSYIRTALVTARSAPAHERVIKTLRSWNVTLDEAFFLGGLAKKDFLKAFGAQIFFDDQSVHTTPASEEVPSARVPYKGGMLGFTDKVVIDSSVNDT